jgi:Cofilin/tropomyosin-type actin-binding protein
MPLKLDNESELREAQAALFNVNSESGWLLLNYVGPSTVHFAAGAEGDVEELSPYLEDNQIQYALVRLGGIQEKGNLKTTIRDVFITWIGPNVGIIEKGKKTAFLGDAKAYLQPFHNDVTVLNKDNLNSETLLDRSSPLSGSGVID